MNFPRKIRSKEAVKNNKTMVEFLKRASGGRIKSSY